MDHNTMLAIGFKEGIAGVVMLLAGLLGLLKWFFTSMITRLERGQERLRDDLEKSQEKLRKELADTNEYLRSEVSGLKERLHQVEMMIAERYKLKADCRWPMCAPPADREG